MGQVPGAAWSEKGHLGQALSYLREGKAEWTRFRAQNTGPGPE